MIQGVPDTSAEWLRTGITALIAAVPNAAALLAWIWHYKEKIDDAAVKADAG